MYKRAYQLSLFTIFYNIIEGIISMIIGYQDEILTLSGFGADSFIEVMSGIGIAVMITRIRQNPESSKNRFEINALKITGTAFYLLSAGLITGIILNLFNRHHPETTFWGIIISAISIFVMIWLMISKRRIGKLLNSEPVIADGNCTRICVYKSSDRWFSRKFFPCLPFYESRNPYRQFYGRDAQFTDTIVYACGWISFS